MENYELKKHFPDYADVFDCLEQDWSGIKEAYVPYAWTDEHYTYSNDDADEFKELVYGTLDLASSISLYSAIASGTLLLCFIWTFCYRKKVEDEFRETLLGMEMGGKESEGGLVSRADTVTF